MMKVMVGKGTIFCSLSCEFILYGLHQWTSSPSGFGLNLPSVEPQQEGRGKVVGQGIYSPGSSRAGCKS